MSGPFKPSSGDPTNVLLQKILRTLAATPVAVSSAADAASAALSDGDFIVTYGYAEVGDGGSAVYRYDATSTETADGGSVITPTSGTGRLKLVAEDVVNVRQFGARGTFDASTFTGPNDTAAFQAAGAYAAATGKAVYIPPGTYGVSDIDPRSGVVWYGAGIGESTICPWNGTTPDNLHCFLTPATGYLRSEFRDLSFRGNNHLTPGLNSGGRAIFARGDEVLLERIEIKDWKYMAVGIIANRATVVHCRVYQCSRDAFNLTGSHKVVFNHNRIERCSDDAIAIHNTTAVTGAVPAPPQPFADVTVTGNQIVDAFGIKILGATRSTVSDNVIHRPKGYGIYVSGIDGLEGHNDPHSVVVTGNVVEDVVAANQIPGFGAGQAGIWVRARAAAAGNILATPGTPFAQNPTGIANDGAGVATVTTTGPHGLFPGTVVVVSGCPETAYNGRAVVLSAPTATTFQYVMSSVIAAGNATGTPRVFWIAPFENYQRVSNTSASVPHGGARQFVVSNNVVSQMLPADNYSVGIASIVRSGSTVTVTTSAPHGLATGEVATITGVTGATEYNNTTGGWTVTVLDAVTYTFEITGTPGAATVTNARSIRATRYEAWGYGGLYNKGEFLNLPVWQHKLSGVGLRVEGGVRDIVVSGNSFHGLTYGIQFTGVAATLKQVVVTGNQFIRFSQFGILGDAVSADLVMRVDGNVFDGDPFVESPQRGAVGDGKWLDTQAYPSGLALVNWRGVNIAGNTFRNLYKIAHQSATSVSWGINTVFGDWVGASSANNRGVRDLGSIIASLSLVWEGSDPTVAGFGTVNFTQGDLSATAMPAAGNYIAGQFVRNRAAAVASSNLVLGWYRLTTGSGHVAGTDWAETRVATAAFSVP